MKIFLLLCPGGFYFFQNILENTHLISVAIDDGQIPMSDFLFEESRFILEIVEALFWGAFASRDGFGWEINVESDIWFDQKAKDGRWHRDSLFGEVLDIDDGVIKIAIRKEIVSILTLQFVGIETEAEEIDGEQYLAQENGQPRGFGDRFLRGAGIRGGFFAQFLSQGKIDSMKIGDLFALLFQFLLEKC